MLAKCGPIIVWHWAHLPGEGHECASAGESEWHLDWKWWALQRGCQIEVRDVVPGFRADIVTPRGNVVELQTKSPSFETITDREEAYGHRLRWVFRMTSEQQDRIRWGKRLDRGGEGFRFKRGPKLMALCIRPTYFDFVSNTAHDVSRVWLRLRPSFYNPEREVLLGVARPAMIGEVFDVDYWDSAIMSTAATRASRQREWNKVVALLSGQGGTSGTS